MRGIRGVQPLVVVDEAHLLDREMLEEVRFLLNFKMDAQSPMALLDQKYEVGLTFVGRQVDIIYDPSDLEELTIEYEGYTPWKAKKLVIGTDTP
jgi:hypothetical protein